MQPLRTGNQGYLGGTTDATTTLTNLGAREYNPATPLFISPDPILSPAQPADLNPYAYAADNPVTNSDPTGLSCSLQFPDNANCPHQSAPTTGTGSTGTGSSSDTGAGNSGDNPISKASKAPCGGSFLNCAAANTPLIEDFAATQGNDVFADMPWMCAALSGGACVFLGRGGGLSATASGKTRGQSGPPLGASRAHSLAFWQACWASAAT